MRARLPSRFYSMLALLISRVVPAKVAVFAPPSTYLLKESTQSVTGARNENALVNYYVSFIARILCDHFESRKTSKLSLGATAYAWLVVRRPWRSASLQPLGATYWIREAIKNRNRQTVGDKLKNGSILKQRRCSGLYRRSHSQPVRQSTS